MSKLLSYKGILFDDWCDEIIDGERRIWAEMCEDHAKQYKDILTNELDDGGTARGTCSVYQCDKSGDEIDISHYYIDFDVNLVKFIETTEYRIKYRNPKKDYAGYSFYQGETKEDAENKFKRDFPSYTIVVTDINDGFGISI
jgi:hypothetical protein